MKAWRPLGGWTVGVAILALAGAATLAAPTPAERKELRAAEAAVRKAGNLYKAKKFDEAARAIETAQTTLAELFKSHDADPLQTQLAPLAKQLARAHELLQREGVKLAPLPESLAAADQRKPAGEAVGFIKQVAPILVAKCGGCHVRDSKGGLSMASFAALQRGSKDGGAVLMPGNGKGSRIVELIEMGDMPRGNGAKVSADELATLTRWIDQGAKFDGPDPAAPLGAAAAAPTAPKLAAAPAIGKEPVQFARDLGAVILAHCVGCHGERNPRGQLSLVTFERLLQGGQNGAIVVPGQPAMSLLVKKLRGTAEGERMPRGKPPLADEVIARFERWIADQARYDGSDPAQALAEAVALVEARSATHEELAERRAALAAKNWSLVLPDAAAERRETANFLLLGNVGEQRLAEVARVAEDLLPKLARQLSLPAGEPLVKGRMTLFVFDKQYDYGELGTMLEKRELPPQWRGHWRFTTVDAYAGLVPAKNKEYALAPLLAQQITGAYVASLAGSPRWFAEGSGRAIAARVDAKDPRVRRWDDQLGEILAHCDKPDAIVAGGLPPEDTDILSYAFAKYLMTSGTRYQSLLKALREAVPFDRAFARAYGGNPKQVSSAWVARAAARGGR